MTIQVGGFSIHDMKNARRFKTRTYTASNCLFVRHFETLGAASFKASGLSLREWNASAKRAADLEAAIATQPKANFGFDADAADASFHDGAFKA